MPDDKTTTRKDGLHCVHGTCRGWPNSQWPCDPGCYFQMSTVSEIEMLRRSLSIGDRPDAE